MEPKQRDEVVRRTDVVSYALLAEINHFHSERAADFNIAMQKFLNEQIVFYQKVSSRAHQEDSSSDRASCKSNVYFTQTCVLFSDRGKTPNSGSCLQSVTKKCLKSCDPFLYVGEMFFASY